jgi:primosomal protein N' (replication factor Y)
VIVEQGALPGLAPRRRARRRKEPDPASVDPVAVVALDLSTPHLDRTFDYLVPARLDAAARPGVRVRVGFGGRSVTGFIVERRDRSEHPGKLAPVARVPSGLPLLTPALWRLAQTVAARQAGVVADVLRLAVPGAHIETEKRLVVEAPGVEFSGDSSSAAGRGDPSGWSGGAGRPSSLDGFVGALGSWLDGAGDGTPDESGPRAVWTALPGGDLLNGLANAVAQTVARGRQALIVAPNEREVTRILRGLTGHIRVARLVAGDGPAARLEAYWAAASGGVDVLVGTRGAAYVPLARPGLSVLVGDGDSALDEPHAPYAGARSVMTVRAGQERTALVIAGLTRTVEAQGLVEAGWMGSVTADRAQVRSVTPTVRAPTPVELAREGATGRSRVPSAAFRVIRAGLEQGPVLVQVPSAEHEIFGLARTAEDLARAFPGTAVKRSAAGAGVLETVDGQPQLVVATPGAEPRAEDGHAAAVLLDGGALTSRPEMDASVNALRVWIGAAGLVKSSGQVMLVGAGGGAAAQALVRWDPVGLAERELEERRELGLPPTCKSVVLHGARDDIDDLLSRVSLPDGTRMAPEDDRTVVLLPLEGARAGLAAVRAAVRARSIARSGGSVRVRVDGPLA